jgi:hypothetical protein
VKRRVEGRREEMRERRGEEMRVGKKILFCWKDFFSGGFFPGGFFFEMIFYERIFFALWFSGDFFLKDKINRA